MMFPLRGRLIHHLPAFAVRPRSPRVSTGPASGGDPADSAIRHLAQGAGSDAPMRCVGAAFDGFALHIGVETATVCAPGFERVYVVTVNRGGGSAAFGAIGAPAIAFDWIVVAEPTRMIAGRDLAGESRIELPDRAIHGTATTFRMEIPADRLPGSGTMPMQYEVAVWTRDTTDVAVEWAAACLDNEATRAAGPIAPTAHAAE